MIGGFTKMLQEDRQYWTRSRLMEMIAVSLAGLATEKLIFNEASTGAQSDLRSATVLARKMVTDLGMSDALGPRTFGDKQELVFLGREISETKDYSERTALAIDREIDKIIREANAMATKILSENKQTLVKLAETLIAKETMDYDSIEEFFKENVPAEMLPKKEVFAELKKAAPVPPVGITPAAAATDSPQPASG
jgi:cell division protease FtsH